MKTTMTSSMTSLACAVALLAASAGTAEAALTTPQINPGSGFVAAATATPCNVTNPPVISVSSTGNAAVWVNFRYKGATWRLPMTNGVTPYCLKMPVIPSGTVEYRIEGGTAFDPYSSTNAVDWSPGPSTYWTYSNTATLSEQRKPTLATWYSTVFQPGNFTDDAHIMSGGINSYWYSAFLSMNFNGTINLRGNATVAAPNLDAALRTRIQQPVGTIWFKARYTGNEGTGTLIVERSTQIALNSTHTGIETVNVPATKQWVQYRIDVDADTASHYYRIRHPSGSQHGTSQIIVKDIVFSPAVADVAIVKSMVEHNPGYPSRTDPVTFTIAVNNLFAGAPASNISPKLVWRLNKGLLVGAWNTAPMAPIGGGEYRVTLPPMEPGDFQYYYRADFTGYAYTGDLYPTPNTTVDNLADFSQWLDTSDRIAEMRFPAYYPDFPNSHLYNVTVDPPVCINDGTVLDEGVTPFNYLGYTIRRFRSMHDEVNLNVESMSGPANNTTYKLEQVGDYIWQSVIHMTNAAAEGINFDVGAVVVGTERYQAPNPYYESQPHNWLAVGQDATAWNPPMAGFLTDNPPNGTPRLRVQIDYDGFMMFRFCTTNGSYEIRRAAWQDFNAWQALNTEYTRSFGLYATTIFESDLDNFPPSTLEPAGFQPFEFNTTPSDDNLLTATYLNGLKVNNAWVIEERYRANPALPASTTRNRALKLSASPVQIGSLETTSATGSDGRDTLTMRVRASVNDDNLAYYRYGDSFTDYIVKAKTTVASMSDDEASVSVYGYYQDPLNYLEGRLTQKSSLTSGQADTFWLTSEIRQMKAGVMNVLQTANLAPGAAIRLNDGTWYLIMKISSGTVEFRATKNEDGTGGTTLSTTFTIDPSVSPGGTIAVNARDAAATFGMVLTDLSGGTGPSGAYALVANSPATSWFRGGLMAGTTNYRWDCLTGTGPTSPTSLTRVIPAVKYRVNVYRDGIGNGNLVAPVPTLTEDWDPNWDDIGTADGERTTSSLAWQNVSVPMHLWDDVFIQIKPSGSDGALVVDDLGVYDWRGMTLYDDVLGENDPFEELVWKATYAIRASVGGNVMYELNRTRANPFENQMIVTPLLKEGIGDIVFNYRVTTGNVKFSVQTIRSNGAVDRTLLTTNVVASSNFERLYVAALTNLTGRLRILVDPIESSPNGVLQIDNLKATDYPDVGDTSWAAYNVLISTYDWSPEIKFDGAANTDYRSATLNNSYSNNTPLNVAYDQDEPFLQSPRIDTGIGEVSFWYRRYPGQTKPGKVYLKAAKFETDFENNPGAVITLGVVDLNLDSGTYPAQVASLASITNVTTDVWAYFSVEFYKAEYKVLRFYGDTATGGRIMLDNIIVTEPVRSSIDIQSVELIPAIPLNTDTVGVRVKLANPRMNPQNLQVSLLYTLGTNQWGRENWMGSAASVPLVAVPGDPYLFSVSNAIPKLPIDAVVQYSVKVSYAGIFPQDVYYGENFVNPPWYEPIDLNAQYAAAGKSAYYYVFSVGTNCVFINEFLPYAYGFTYYGLGEQYVELIGVDKGNIANWRLEHVNAESTADEDVVFWTNVLKAGAAFTSRYVAGSQEPTGKGWGFYTLACASVNNSNPNFSAVNPNPIVVDQELFPDYLYLAGYGGFAPGYENIAMGVPGALCLRRSMGAYVDRVAWGDATTVAKLLQRGYTYAGSRGTGSTARRRVFSWADNADQVNPALAWEILSSSLYSPGYYNDGQAELIWTVVPSDAQEPVPFPVIGQPKITAVSVGQTMATVVFDVWITNDVELAPQSDYYTWYVEFSEEPTFANPTAQEISGIGAASDGTPSSYSVDVNLGGAASRFYRIKAVPKP